MAFQVSDYHDLVRLLNQHPEWREELRHLLLTPDVLELPQAVRELVEAHKRAEERLTRLEQAVAELAEGQKELIEAHKRSEERLTRLEQSVAELTEAQKRNEERFARMEQAIIELTEAQKKTEEKLQKLTERVDIISIHVDELRGDMLEIRFRQRAFSYFGKLVSRAQVVDLQDIWTEWIEPNLSDEERNDLISLDLLIRGHLNRSWEEKVRLKELWLAVEVSGVIDQNDVRRARRRADLLSKAGLQVIPVAAGREMTKGADLLAKEMGVILQKDGSLLYTEEALERFNELRQE